MTNQTIDIVNVRQHNLKGFDLSIPLGKITVLTGPSGSGKSSLALDVLFAEGQYRYLESLGMAVKRIVDLWDRPLVDSIKGLPPPPLHSSRSPLCAAPGPVWLLSLAQRISCACFSPHVAGRTVQSAKQRSALSVWIRWPTGFWISRREQD